MAALKTSILLALSLVPFSVAAQTSNSTLSAGSADPLWYGPLPVAPTSRPAWLLILALLLLTAATLLYLIRRSRQRLPVGSASAIAGYMQSGLRTISWSLLATAVLAIAWPWLSWWVAGGILAALGLLSIPLWPDLVAGLVLRSARGIRPGVRIESGVVAGRVVVSGWLAATLGDEAGGTHSVPNRWLLAQPLQVLDASSPATSIEVDVVDLPLAQARRTILDAVLSSPWVPAGAEVRVDHLGGSRYRVRTEVLSAAYQGQLGSDLSERIERARPVPPAS